MALYLGGRLNELSQLYLKDIIVVHDTHCVDFNLDGEGKLDIDEADDEDGSDKSLKNISSARIIPIPQTLIDCGFIAYVERLREMGQERLFPELLFDPEKGYGKYAGKWFNDSFLGKQLQIPRDGKKTFHSMRHNFATALGELNPMPNDKADLMGHKRKGSTTDLRYDKGAFARRKRLMEQIVHPHPALHRFDVEQGIKALTDAIRLKTSRLSASKKNSLHDSSSALLPYKHSIPEARKNGAKGHTWMPFGIGGTRSAPPLGHVAHPARGAAQGASYKYQAVQPYIKSMGATWAGAMVSS